MSVSMTGAQVAIAQLVAQGVTHVFSIPGEHNIALCDALLDYPELTYLTGRHEQGLTLIANGYSRVSHRIAVPLLISGPGVTNGLTTLGDALQDSVPMVVIAAQAPQNQIGRGSFHGLKDQSGVIASVAKWSICVRSVAEIPVAIRTAFMEAYSSRPGPTVVEIPLDVQTQTGDIEIGADIYAVAIPQPQAAPTDIIEKAVAQLVQARSPVVIVGRGAVISGAREPLIQLIEWLNAPCFCTALAKGVIPNNHTLNISWGNGRSNYLAQLVEAADVVLVVGSSLDYADAGRSKLTFTGILIQIDTCAQIPGRFYPVDLALIGDAKATLTELISAIQLKQTQPRSLTVPKLPETAVDTGLMFPQHRTEKLAFFQEQTAWQYINAIQQAITSDTIVFGDPARCNGWGVAFLDRDRPNTYHCSRNFCTLGYAIAAAMGAKLAEPNRQILAMIGDGGLLFGMGDLATVVQYQLQIVIVVFNDNCYGSIRKAQRQSFGRTIGVDLHNPDFCALAQSFGLSAIQVTEPVALTAALKNAWKQSQPTLIEIAMTPDDPGFEI